MLQGWGQGPGPGPGLGQGSPPAHDTGEEDKRPPELFPTALRTSVSEAFKVSKGDGGCPKTNSPTDPPERREVPRGLGHPYTLPTPRETSDTDAQPRC